ncbi:MAG: pyruvate dehydrogenase (acetyl-transferring) E1 component subunit alpha [Opitutales bacterium]
MAKKSAAVEAENTIQTPFPTADADIEALVAHEANASLSAEDKVRLYTDMVRIRRFEERCIRVYQQGKIGGFLHLYIGQEALAVGTTSLMQENDHVITAYRDHGHALAVGMSMNECMAELTGKHTGCSKGKGGSMHFFAPDKNFWGGHGIVGGQVPLGTGLAFALKYKGLSGCCLTFMGDGAVNQGAVHEAFNLAALWDLPTLFIIENNGYSMGTSEERSSAHPGSLAERAHGYGMESDTVNGHILYEVRAKTHDAMKKIRETHRPMVIEMFTYRYRGHSMSDPDKAYRKKEEIQEYRRTRDPLTVFESQLKDEGHLDDDKVEAIDKSARSEADAAAEFADQSPFPPPESILEDIYWEEDNRTEETPSRGTIIFE